MRMVSYKTPLSVVPRGFSKLVHWPVPIRSIRHGEVNRQCSELAFVQSGRCFLGVHTADSCMCRGRKNPCATHLTRRPQDVTRALLAQPTVDMLAQY